MNKYKCIKKQGKMNPINQYMIQMYYKIRGGDDNTFQVPEGLHYAFTRLLELKHSPGLPNVVGSISRWCRLVFRKSVAGTTLCFEIQATINI